MNIRTINYYDVETTELLFGNSHKAPTHGVTEFTIVPRVNERIHCKELSYKVVSVSYDFVSGTCHVFLRKYTPKKTKRSWN